MGVKLKLNTILDCFVRVFLIAADHPLTKLFLSLELIFGSKIFI